MMSYRDIEYSLVQGLGQHLWKWFASVAYVVRAVVPVESPEPELKTATATGLNCQRDRLENTRP
jgi:hypothetical protein